MNTLTDRPRMNLAGIDWHEAWARFDATRSAPPSVAHWDRRASTYTRSHGADGAEYAREFLAHAGIEPGERVLDFGCGDGLLSIPLAQMGCTVVACDFSQSMLDHLMLRAQEAGVAGRIETHRVAWEDDWQTAGLAPESVDVAVASRSLSTGNMLASLRKLDAAARRKVCLAVAAAVSPRRDERAYQAVGRPAPWTADYAYVMNLLFQYGVFPQLSYITTHPRPGFTNRAEALEALAAMLGNNLDAREQRLLEEFVDAHYAPDPTREPERAYSADAERPVRWALITWGA